MLQSQIVMAGDIRERLAGSEFKEVPAAAPRITVIGDREFLNLQAIIDFANTYPTAVQLGGIIVPGHEMNGEIMRIADRVNGMREHGLATPDGWPVDKGSGDWHFSIFTGEERFTTSDGQVHVVPIVKDLFHYLHAPYDAVKLRSDENYRREYCEGLLELIKITGPDFIFLSNFKVFLHPVVVEAYPRRIINVHPSILPLLKGFRPEQRADSGENPQALGYTFNVADADLDGGPTLFQQKVSIDSYDPEQEARLGKNVYARLREEKLRLKIIQAQAQYTPRILTLYSSSAEKIIVDDDEAFVWEGRAGFENSPEYQTSLEQEYDKWRKEHDQELSQDQWYQQYRKPYRRILFDVGEGWQTAEAILGAMEYAELATPSTMTRYHIKIPGDNETAFTIWDKLITELKILSGEGSGQPLHTQAFFNTVDGKPLLHGSILCSVDTGPLLTVLGIEFTAEEMPTRVTASRKPAQ